MVKQRVYAVVVVALLAADAGDFLMSLNRLRPPQSFTGGDGVGS